jgi:hypothetical protein
VTGLRAPYRTNSGRMLDLATPDPDVLDLEDIAHNLARVCRFGGAVDEFYSVASHSVYVARRLREEYCAVYGLAAAGLLHDAAEAYLGDMTSGLKRLFPDYRELERRWEYAIEGRWGVAFVQSGIIKTADLRARLAEARDLFGGRYPRELLLGGEGTLEPYEAPCLVQTPDEAEHEFLGLARELGLFP